MRTHLEQEDIQAIAMAIVEILQTLVADNGKQDTADSESSACL